MSTPGFLEIQLDPKVSNGCKAGVSYTTAVVTNPSRVETRFPQQSRGYWTFSINLNDKSKAQMVGVIQQHFVSVQGKAYGWRFRNWREYQLINEPQTLFTGGTQFQLSKMRGLTARTELVLVKKPDLVMPIVLQRDTGSGPATFTDFTVDNTTGIVTFGTSQDSTFLFYATGTFDTPVRFDTDMPDITWDDFDIFNWPDIKVMEVQI